MVIPDIQTQNLNGATFQPNVSTADVIRTQDAVAAINTDSKSDSSATGSDASDTLAAYSTKVTLTSEKSRAEKSESADKKASQENSEVQESAGKEYSMTMTGIPLFGGMLVSVIKYPDGQSEMFDAITGKPISAEDIALQNVLLGAESDQVLHFESAESYNGLSEAEVYQRIQELLGKDKANDTDIA